MALEVEIGRVERPRDYEEIINLDVTYETAQAFRVTHDSLGVCARLVDLETPLYRQFPIDLEADRWTDGWVARNDGRIAGFVATGFEPWNRRLSIWHFYVGRAFRRQGCGRQLLEQALAEGVSRGASMAWAETSNFNAPGVAAYRKLGFELRGFDQSLFGMLGSSDEFALFLSRPVAIPAHSLG